MGVEHWLEPTESGGEYSSISFWEAAVKSIGERSVCTASGSIPAGDLASCPMFLQLGVIRHVPTHRYGVRFPQADAPLLHNPREALGFRNTRQAVDPRRHPTHNINQFTSTM